MRHFFRRTRRAENETEPRSGPSTNEPSAPPGLVHPEAVVEPGVVLEAGIPQGHRGIRIGACSRVRAGCRLVAFARESNSGIEIGERCDLSNDCQLLGQGGITIGNDVIVGPKVLITSVGHEYRGAGLIREQAQVLKEVVVEDDVWIGAGAIVLPGVRIGRHAVIGAGAVVTRDVPPHHLAVGVPARPRPLDEDDGAR